VPVPPPLVEQGMAEAGGATIAQGEEQASKTQPTKERIVKSK